MLMFDFKKFPEIEKKAKEYTPEKIAYLINSWVMVSQMYINKKKKLQEHLDIFKQVQDMTITLGGYVFYKASLPLQGLKEGSELMIGDKQYDLMEKDLERLGVPKEHVSGLLNTYLQAEILGNKEDIERSIFGKTLEEMEQENNG